MNCGENENVEDMEKIGRKVKWENRKSEVIENIWKG